MEQDDCILIEDKVVTIDPSVKKINPKKELAEIKNKQGSTFYSNKQFLNARNAYSEAITLDPYNAVFYANRAAAKMNLDELDTVLDDLDQAINLDPSYQKTYTRKFNFLISIGQVFKAEQVNNQIKLLDSNKQLIDQNKTKLSFISLNRTFYENAIIKKDYRASVHYLDKILEFCTSSIDFKLKKAESLAHLSRHDEVVGIVDPILHKDLTNSEGYFIRGLSYFNQGNLDRAINFFTRALRIEPEHKRSRIFIKNAKAIQSRKKMSKDAINCNDLDKAIIHYKVALAIDPNFRMGNAKLHFNLSVLYSKQNNTKEALDEINEAIKLDENYDKAYMKRACLYDDLEMYEESIRDYEFLYRKLKSKQTKYHLERAKLLLIRSKLKNYYKVLGLTKMAEEKEIRQAYIKLAKDHHPDRHVNAEESERINHEKKFKEVGEAYNCLIDPIKRQRYDCGYVDANQGSSFDSNKFRMFCDPDVFNSVF